MKNVLGIMDLYEDDKQIRTLTTKRPVATLPFAGRYRLLDFALSSMVNSGITKIGMMMPAKSRSILDHLRSGKDWDLARRHDGLFYLPAIKMDKDSRNGNLQSFYRHMSFIRQSEQEYVLICNSRFVYNIDFTTALRFHQNTGADITMVYHIENKERPDNATILQTGENGLVTEIANRPAVYENSKVFMGIYLMSRKKFMEIISTAYERGGYDFLIDGILRHQDNLNIYGFQHEGYVSEICSTSSYFKTNMDLLEPEIWEELFMGYNPIYTRVRDESNTSLGKELLMEFRDVLSAAYDELLIYKNIERDDSYVKPLDSMLSAYISSSVVRVYTGYHVKNCYIDLVKCSGLGKKECFVFCNLHDINYTTKYSICKGKIR